MRKRTIDLALSVLASIGAFLLSWPYWRDFEYWAESQTAWVIYFVIGFVLAVWVFYMFLHGVHTLFEHDALDKRGATDGEVAERENAS